MELVYSHELEALKRSKTDPGALIDQQLDLIARAAKIERATTTAPAAAGDSWAGVALARHTPS